MLEYVLRRRSQSSDRATVGGPQSQQQQKMATGKQKRAERRLTQPVELGSIVGSAEKAEIKKGTKQEEVKPALNSGGNDEKCLLETDF